MKIGFSHLALLALILFLSTETAEGQAIGPLQSFQEERNAINKTGMLVLGSWAVGNILVGTIGNQKSGGDTKYFHQFNALWNLVNLGIASYGYFNATTDPSAMSTAEIMKEFHSLQSFLLLNAGLDVAYMVTGLYLKERAKSSASGDRLRGYGNSLLLQGGFLLAFDTALYFIHQHNASLRLTPYLGTLAEGTLGITMTVHF